MPQVGAPSAPQPAPEARNPLDVMRRLGLDLSIVNAQLADARRAQEAAVAAKQSAEDERDVLAERCRVLEARVSVLEESVAVRDGLLAQMKDALRDGETATATLAEERDRAEAALTALSHERAAEGDDVRTRAEALAAEHRARLAGTIADMRRLVADLRAVAARATARPQCPVCGGRNKEHAEDCSLSVAIAVGGLIHDALEGL